MNAKRVDQNHDPIFTKEDEDEATSALKIAIIREFRKRKITYSKFSQMYLNHYIKKSHNRGKMITDRNNLIASLLGSNTITYDKFVQVLRDILEVNLVGINLITMDRNGKKNTIKVSVKTF